MQNLEPAENGENEAGAYNPAPDKITPKELPPPGDDDDDDGGGPVDYAAIGFIDTLDPLNGSTGWSLNPSYPELSINVAFYANAPYGEEGSVYLGQVLADLPRPDVNEVTGYPGNHGFNWIIPRIL